MKIPHKPAGGQPANLQIGTPIKPASGTLAMTVHIEENWNPHNDLLAIADYARNCCKRVDAANERFRDRDEPDRIHIEVSQMREINMMTCLLAMRLSACKIIIPREETK